VTCLQKATVFVF